jgi:hypothetical protein
VTVYKRVSVIWRVYSACKYLSVRQGHTFEASYLVELPRVLHLREKGEERHMSSWTKLIPETRPIRAALLTIGKNNVGDGSKTLIERDSRVDHA